jgi:UDP-N-acetyl-D-glucosamine dehydrogenase
VRNTPKLVAGVTSACAELAGQLYATIVDEVVTVSSTKVAELAKLHENTFRAVNIALANELALMCDRLGVSAWEVIEAAATKPFAFLPHYPGPGLGGDCIPVVPHFLTWRLPEYGYSTRMIDAAHEINVQMPVHVVGKIADALNSVGKPINGSRVLLLGAAYKADVHDTRESPSLVIMGDLRARGRRRGDLRPVGARGPAGGRRHRGDGPVVARRGQGRRLRRPAHRSRRVPAEAHWEHAALLVDTRNVLTGREGAPVWRL